MEVIQVTPPTPLVTVDNEIGTVNVNTRWTIAQVTIYPQYVPDSFGEITRTDPQQISDAELQAWLDSRTPRTTSLVVDTCQPIVGVGGTVPLVADSSLCVETGPDPVDGTATASRNALITSRWWSESTTTAGSGLLGTLTTLAPTLTVNVAALPSAWPLGLGISTPGNVVMVLNAAAAAGATSITLRRLNANATINGGDVLTVSPTYYPQGGATAARIENYSLIANPDTLPNSQNIYNDELKYVCDGIRTKIRGQTIVNNQVALFPGHGIWLSYRNVTNSLYGREMPWEREECRLLDNTVRNCLTNFSIDATDVIVRGCVSTLARDIGFNCTTNCGAVEMSQTHSYGDTLGYNLKNVRGSGFYIDNDLFGMELNGSYNYLADVKALGNQHTNVRFWADNSVLDGYDCNFSRSAADAATIATNPLFAIQPLLYLKTWPDANCVGYGLVVGSYADESKIQNVNIRCTGDAANGIRVGHNTGKTLAHLTLTGRVTSDTAARSGLDIPAPLRDSTINLYLSGNRGLYVEAAATLTRNTITLRGPGATPVRWGDTTTGTFATPNIPVAVSAANTITFINEG